MADNKIPFLCGGTFFFLISGIKQGVSAREHAKGIKDEVKNENIMDDLVFAVAGRRYNPGKAEVSQYRSCSVNGSSGIPLDDKSIRDSFSDAVLHDYTSPHRRITEFLDKYMVGQQQRTWFVKALLDIILHDDSIAEENCFYIKPNGICKTKSEIREMREFDYQPFVLGVIHFIVTTRYGQNKDGRETFDAWKNKEGNEYKYNGNAGEGIPYKITVKDLRPCDEHVDAPNVEKGAKTDEDAIADDLKADAYQTEKQERLNKKMGSSDGEPETVEAEVVDDGEPSGAAEEDKEITVIKQQTNVVQNGDNNVNVTNNGTMNFNF